MEIDFPSHRELWPASNRIYGCEQYGVNANYDGQIAWAESLGLEIESDQSQVQAAGLPAGGLRGGSDRRRSDAAREEYRSNSRCSGPPTFAKRSLRSRRRLASRVRRAATEGCPPPSHNLQSDSFGNNATSAIGLTPRADFRSIPPGSRLAAWRAAADCDPWTDLSPSSWKRSRISLP